MRRRWFGAVAIAITASPMIVGVGVGAAAFAQVTAPSVDLAWTAPPLCPSQSAVLTEVRSNLEGSTATAHPVAARAVVTRAAQRWHVELAIKSDQGEGVRSIDADSCTELAGAVALIVALAVDPTWHAPLPDASSPSSVLDGGAPVAVPVPPSAPRATPSPSSNGPRLTIGASGLVDVGTMPSAAGGGALSIAGLYQRARIEARGRKLATQRADDPSRPTQGVDLSHLGFDGRGCFALVATGQAARDGLEVGPCLGVDFSRMSGSGFGGQKTLAGDASWFALQGGLLGTWALASFFAVRASADLLVPTSRPAFVVLAPDGAVALSLHRPAALGGRLDLGAEIRFW